MLLNSVRFDIYVQIVAAGTDKRSLPAHSIPLVAQGTLILWFGFLAFNAGTATSTSFWDRFSPIINFNPPHAVCMPWSPYCPC